MELISNDMLSVKKYDMYILEKNIMNLSSKKLLSTQELSAEFCCKYILNSNYSEGVEEDYLYSGDFVLKKQKHISKEELLYWIKKTAGSYF
jgi:hypothetical protein